MSNLNKIVYLSEEQKNTLFTNDTITVNGVTVNYNQDDLYVTPDIIDAAPVQGSTNVVTSDGIYQALNTKAPVASPSLTGVPTAPTAAFGTATDQIATTAFVMQAIQGTIVLTINAAVAGTTIPSGITITASLNEDTYTATTTSALNTLTLTIPVGRFGLYNLSFSDPRIQGVHQVEVLNAAPYYVSAYFNELLEYSLIINEDNSNPLSACTYADDAIGMTKGANAWDQAPIFNQIKPCMYKNNSVQYYLDKTDFTKKEDGTLADLSGADGDVMIEFCKFAYKIKRFDDHYLKVSITNDPSIAEEDTDYTYDAFSRLEEGDLDRIYIGAFKGWVDGDGFLRSLPGHQPAAYRTIGRFRACAQNRNTVNGVANTNHYQQMTYAALKAIQCLYLIKYGNLDSQTAVGPGATGYSTGSYNQSLVTGYNVPAESQSATGEVTVSAELTSANTTLDKGMIYAGTNLQHMRLFGIEDFWGNIYEWVDGLTTDASWNIITSWNTFNNEPVSSTSSVTTSSGLSANVSGYINKVAGNTDAGFMPVQFSGSSSTFWCDWGYLYSSRVLFFGGYWYNGAYAGAFQLYANGSSGDTYRNIGARLTAL